MKRKNKDIDINSGEFKVGFIIGLLIVYAFFGALGYIALNLIGIEVSFLAATIMVALTHLVSVLIEGARK